MFVRGVREGETNEEREGGSEGEAVRERERNKEESEKVRVRDKGGGWQAASN